jgi:hypothetical protein
MTARAFPRHWGAPPLDEVERARWIRFHTRNDEHRRGRRTTGRKALADLTKREAAARLTGRDALVILGAREHES